MRLEGDEMQTAVNALRVAADVYGDDAVKMRNLGSERLAQQFYRQVDEANALADKIEERA